jgi:hypothetical protein
MSWYGAFSENKSSQSSKSSSISDIPGDPVKIAEAIAIVGEKQVRDRGGVNAQGYFNDVPQYQQLSAADRARVTNDGIINTTEMLEILNKQSIAAGHGPIIPVRNNDVISAPALTSNLVAATPPTPEIAPAMRMFSVETAPVKTAPIDTILFDEEAVPIEVMADLIFENIGGQELLSIARSDIINGQKISYQPIKNLSAIQQQYNPNNILGLQQTSDKFFAGFAIKLENKIPEEGNGTNGNNVYLNDSGDLVIEFINLNNDEQIETQITTSGTIYEADLGEYVS